jgi:hypothetical protein
MHARKASIPFPAPMPEPDWSQTMRSGTLAVALVGLVSLGACEGADQTVEGHKQDFTFGPWSDTLNYPDVGPAPYGGFALESPCEVFDDYVEAFHVGNISPSGPDDVFRRCLYIDHDGKAKIWDRYHVLQTPPSPYAQQEVTYDALLHMIVPTNAVRSSRGFNPGYFDGNPLCRTAGGWGEAWGDRCHYTYWDARRTPVSQVRQTDDGEPWSFLVNPSE